MPAQSADIAAASRDVVVAAWSSGAIAARYPGARDGSTTPDDGYFDSIADAQTIIDARGALIGTERRRFNAVARHVLWPDLTTGIPQVQLIDSEQSVSGNFLVARIEIDLEAETTSYECFG
jgi:hypothetical protein